MAMALCIVCASPRGVVVDRRRACPHRRDVGPLVHSRCQWCRDPLGHNGSARLCVGLAVVGPTLVTPECREAPEDEGTIRLYVLVYLCRCGDRPLRLEGWYNMATHPSDS